MHVQSGQGPREAPASWCWLHHIQPGYEQSPTKPRGSDEEQTQQAWPVPSSMHVQSGVTVDSIDDGVFGHDEADITIISYTPQAADDGCHVVRVLSYDTGIFVLLVYWTWRCDLQDRLAVQMEKWDGVVLDVNATCAHLGSTVCSQLLGAHAITGCDTVSYPFGKGKASMLKTLKEGDFPGLFDVLGEEGASQEYLTAVGEQFFGHCMDNRQVAP